MNNFNKFFVLVLFFFIPQMNAQILKKYRFDEVEQLVGQDARPIVIFFYTDWCSYCKMMQRTTFRDKEIINLLNTSYYFIEINGEDKAAVFHLQKTFKYVPSGINTGSHEIVNYYLKGHPKAYPSLVILNAKFDRKTVRQSYLNSSDFRRFLSH